MSCTERRETISCGERWLLDAFDTVPLPGGCCVLDVDVSNSLPLLAELRDRGVKATPTHLFVRSVALALQRHPDLNSMVVGKRRMFYDQVSVSLSVASETAMAALMLIEDAGRKSLPEIAAEIIERAPVVRSAESVQLAKLRRWGWLVPAAFLRRMILRWLRTQSWFRRRRLGTIQITTVPGLDVLAPLTFGTAAIVAFGRVRDRVVVHDGQPAVRPVVTVACSFNHKVWDGMRVQRFLREVASILDGGELRTEVCGGSEEAGAG